MRAPENSSTLKSMTISKRRLSSGFASASTRSLGELVDTAIEHRLTLSPEERARKEQEEMDAIDEAEQRRTGGIKPPSEQFPGSLEAFSELTEKKLSAAVGKVASVAVIAQGKLLMGKRRDSGKWTLPGGHMNPGEPAIMGGVRELREEAGIVASTLDPLGFELIQGRTGRSVEVHAFKYETEVQPTSLTQDPDNEIQAWEWVDVRSGLPPEIAANLHSPKNLVLQKLGLL